MLDTDICIYIIKEQPKHVARRFACTHASEILMSAITYAELIRGVKKSAQVATNLAKLRLLAQEILVTNNEKEFRRVPGLHVENWAA